MPIVLPSFAGTAQPAGGAAYSNALSASFDGTDDIIDVGDVSAINSATNLTISGWFNASSFPHASYNSMWGGGGAGGSTHPTRFWLTCNNGSLFRIWYGTSTNFTFAYSISTGTWYNVVLTIDGSTVKLYVNGNQEGSTVTTAPSVYATAGDEFEIGANPTYRPYYWDGYIDEFAVFNSTLSASDVTAIYNSGVPADLTSLSPVHWWRMGDGTGDTDDGGGAPASGDTIGTIADQGSGSNNGTGTNGPAFSSNVPFSTTSAIFDGTNDYARATLGSQVFDGDYSISFWINPDSTQFASLLQLGTSATYADGFRVYRYSSGQAFWRGEGGSSYVLAISTPTAINTWHHLAITRSGSNVTMYHNGSSIQTGTDSHAYTSTTFNVSFTTYPFDGFQDEVALWDSALSASDVTAIYNSGTPASLASYSPVNWWRMGENDGGAGTTVTDQGSAGNDLTLYNGASFSTNVP